MDAYKTLAGTAQARFEEKKSVFLAYASFADSEEAAQEVLRSVRAVHRTARHHVYAYILREGARTRYSDDGEPAKTSGLPTLEVLRGAGLTDAIIVTARYFGGTLLGTGGLVRAYTKAAQMALDAARQVTMHVCVRGTVRVEYALYEQAARLLTDAGAQLDEPLFTDRVELPFLLRDGGQEALRAGFRELCRGEPALTLSAPFCAPFAP